MRGGWLVRRLWTLATVLVCAAAAALAPDAAEALPVPLPAPWGPTNGVVDTVAVDPGSDSAYLGGTFHGLGPVIGGFAAVSPSTGLLDRGVEPSGGWTPIDLDVLVGDGSGGVFGAGEVRLGDGSIHRGLVHVLASGALDSDFLPEVTGTVHALARSGTTLFVGGQFTSIDGSSAHPNLAAVSTGNGALLAWAAGAPDGTVRALAVGGTELAPALYAGGDFTHVGGVAHAHLAGFVARTGTLEPSFTATTNESVHALAARGAIVYAGGTFTTAGGHKRDYAAAFSIVDGSPTSFDPEPDGAVLALAATEATVYLGGYFEHVGGARRLGLAAVSASTSTPTSFRTDLQDSELVGLVDALALSGGTLYAAGAFTEAGVLGTPARRHDTIAVDATSGTPTSWDPSPNAGVGLGETFGLAADSGHVFIGGKFTTVAAVYRNSLAEVDLGSGEADAWNPDVEGEVDALAIYGGRVYAGGRFTHVNGPFEERVDVAAFEKSDGLADSWDADIAGSVNARVSSIVADSHGVLIGGVFQEVGGQAREAVAEVAPSNGALLPFDPKISYGHETVPSGIKVARTSDGGNLLAGVFDHAGLNSRPLAARFTEDGTLMPFTLDPTAGFGEVNALLPDGDTGYIAGGVTAIDGVAMNGLGAVDLTTGIPTAFEARLRASSIYSVDALLELGGRLYVGGSFLGIGGTFDRPTLAAIDPTGGDDSGWGARLADESVVRGLAGSAADGLIAVGLLSGVAGAPADGVVRYAVEPAAPAAPVANAGVASATVTAAAPADGGSPVTRYTATASPGGATASSSTPTIAVGGLTPGTSYTFRVVATNAAGDSPASPPSNPVVPTAPEGTGGGSGDGGGGGTGGAGTEGGSGGGSKGGNGPSGSGGQRHGGDRTPPALSGVRLAPTSFRDRGPKRGRHLHHPLFARLHLTLSEDARVSLVVTRRAPGRRHGGVCRAAPAGTRHDCKRTVTVLRLPAAALAAGPHSLPFRAKQGSHRLAPGHYALTLVATDAAGNASAPSSRAFTVTAR